VPQWSSVTNLGDSINTPGNEISPFIHSNGRDLYFSSDFRPGFGGYDIFHSHHSPSGIWSEARNFGYPVNSQGNEQGLIIDRSGEKAYFASNRVLSGNMDIFSSVLDKKIRPEAASYIQGEVIDKKTGTAIQSVVQLSWIDTDNPAELEIPTDEMGIFQVVLPLKDSLSLTVNKKGFLFYSENFILSDPSSALHPIIRKIYLSPLESGSFVDIYNIYFDTDAFTLLPASLPGLQNLLKILSDNPSLNIEIQGHTDNTGSDEHNLWLSEQRAKAVVEFLNEKGIPASGISARGYGSGKPVAPNDTEEGRSKNRRTTILIL
jgi:outer membrane protein OmpA-like peptidoglycan-associated protein